MINLVPIKLKVFIEGLDVSDKVSSISNFNMKWNSISTCNITLECDDNDFVVTRDDLKQIKAGNFDFKNPYKSYFLSRFGNEKSLITNQSLYKFGVYSHVIPVRSHVRVFVRMGEDDWYLIFSGVVVNRSVGVSDTGRVNVLYRCEDALYFFRKSLITTSVGVFDPARNIQKVLEDIVGETETIDKPGYSNFMFFVPKVKEGDVIAFGIHEQYFLKALVSVMYGANADPGEETYGSPLSEIKVFYNVPGVGEQIRTVTRNRNGAGFFNLKAFEVGIYGRNSSSLRDELLRIHPWGEKIKVIPLDNLALWDKRISNKVAEEDLDDLCILPQLPFRPSISTMEDVVDFIGQGTHNFGFYPVDGGALKILLPGSLTDEIYRSLRPTFDIKIFETDFYQYSTRLQAFAHVLTLLSNFLFYVNGKGHVVCEFPLLDVEQYGEDNWRVFDADSRIGSFSDNEDFSGLASYARHSVEVGTTALAINGKVALSEIKTLTQGAVDLAMFEKIGLVVLEHNVKMGLRALTEEGAKEMAALLLTINNREKYTGSCQLVFQPEIMLNRPIVLSDLGRYGLVVGQSHSINVGGNLVTNVNLGYMKQEDEDGQFRVAFGEDIRNIGIDYYRFFNRG